MQNTTFYCVCCMYSFASLNILNPKYIKQNVFSSPNCQCISRYHDPKVECDQCGESVPAYRLKLHKKSHWSEDQLPFKCSFCSKGFLQKNKLVDHENMHRGEKPHKVISIAPSLFFLGYGLLFCTNLQETTPLYLKHCYSYFQCDQCGLGYADRGNLNAHIKTVHLGIKRKQKRA